MATQNTVRRSFTDPTGRRHFVRGRDADDAAVKLDALKKKIRGEIFVPDDLKTVAEWCAEYMHFFIRPQVQEESALDIERMFKKRILPEIGNAKLSMIRPLHLQKILLDAAGMSYSYRYKLTLEIKRLFRLARQNQLITIDPAETLRFPAKKDEKIGRALTEDEKAAITAFIPRHRFGLEVALMLYAGLRDQEVIALDKGKIRPSYNEIVVDRAMKRDGYLGPPKSKAGVRTVPLQAKLLPLLEGRLGGDPDEPVCVQTHGGRHSRSSFREGWRNFLRELNISLGAQVFRNQLVGPLPVSPDLRPYYLRHTFCTECERLGIPVQVTARIMGHSSTAVTLRYYTHPSRAVQDMALAALNGAGWEAGGTQVARITAPIGPN